MNSEYLEEFLVVAQRMNFTAAAKYLNMTQSSVSKHIAALEREFNCTLFRRGVSGIELTQQGRILCTDAQRILGMIKDTRDHLKAADTTLRFAGGVEDEAIIQLLSETTSRMLADNPSFTFSVEQSSCQPLIVQLLSGEVDLCIQIALEDETVDPHCESCIAAVVPLVAIVEKNHPLAAYEELSINDLQGHYIVHPCGGSLEFVRGIDSIDNFFRRHDVNVGQKLFFADSSRDFAFFNIEDNIFVTPRSNFSHRLFPNNLESYRAIPFKEDDAVFTYRLVWRKGDANPQVERFRNTFLEVSGEFCYRASLQDSQEKDEQHDSPSQS